MRLIVRVVEDGETHRPLAAREGDDSLQALWKRRMPGNPPAAFQLQRLEPFHTIYRSGFPGFRRLLATAPHAVMTGGKRPPAWAGMLAATGLPVFAEDQADWPVDKLGPDARWTRPTLSAPGLVEKARAAHRITLLGEGVAARPDDGFSVATDLFGAFATPAPSCWICRRRVLHLPFPERQGTVYTCPPEDTALLGEPSVAIAGRTTDASAMSTALIRSSAVWPTVGLKGAGALVSVPEVWRTADGTWSRPEIQLALLLRQAGVKAPIVWRMLAADLAGELPAQMALELGTLIQVAGPFTIEADGEPREAGRPVNLHIEMRDVRLGFLMTGLAEWIARCRGSSGSLLDSTFVQADGEIIDNVAASGYRVNEPAPEGTPVVYLGLPPLAPLW